MSRWAPDFRSWPRWQLIVAAIACVVGVVLLVLAPWRPWLGLLGLLMVATVILALDAWGLRRRTPLLRSGNARYVAGGWGLVGGCLLVTATLALLPQSPPSHRQAARASAPPPAALTGPLGTTSPAPVTPSPTPSPIPSRPPATRSTAKPLSVAFLNAPLSAHPRQQVTLRVLTAPNTGCSISVAYPSAPSLGSATSDGAGNVSWAWRVSNQAPAGSWPIRVSCGGATASTVITVLTVD